MDCWNYVESCLFHYSKTPLIKYSTFPNHARKVFAIDHPELLLIVFKISVEEAS